MQKRRTARKRRFGDRYDGFRVRNIDSYFKLIPHIMRTRTDSQVSFEETINLSAVESYIRQLRNNGHTDIRVLYVLIAAIVRVISQKPHANRFIAGRKLYARNDIAISLAVKQSMSEEGKESTIKMHFSPTDTIFDIINKTKAQYLATVGEDPSNGTDVLAKVLAMLPSPFIHFLVFAMRNFDKIGLLPKAMHEFSPFHASLFITDVGSLGIGPVYHHLYEFGTCSIFISFGKKETKHIHQPDGTLENKRNLTVRFVVDERVCDGYYFASAIKLFKRILQKPEQLSFPPEKVVEDEL